MSDPLLLRRTARAAVVVASAIMAACGARGPLEVVVEQEPDAGAIPAPNDAQARPVGTAAPEAGVEGGGLEGGGLDGGALLSCGTCLAQHCGMQLYACFASTTCRTTLECAATMCLSGGMPSLGCVLGCANGDPASLTQLVGLLGCVTGNCGSQCTSLLGTLGRTGGFGGGG
jgi:hypothetical protein